MITYKCKIKKLASIVEDCPKGSSRRKGMLENIDNWLFVEHLLGRISDDTRLVLLAYAMKLLK